MARAIVRLLSADAVLDENGRLTNTPVLSATISLDLAQSNDEFPEGLQRQQDRFVKVFPGHGALPPAYKRIEGGVNASNEPLLPYSESTVAVASTSPGGGGGRVA